MWVQWYSRHSCQWSKWRHVAQDWLCSDPDAALQLSHGQRIRVSFDGYPAGELSAKSR